MSTRRGRPRYFVNDGSDQPFNATAEISKQLSHLVTAYPPHIETFLGQNEDDLLGFYSGPTSIAYGLFVISPRWTQPVEGKTVLEWANAYLDIAAEVMSLSTAEMTTLPVDSHVCGIIHQSACQTAVKAAMRHDDAALQTLLSYVSTICADAPLGKDVNDEWVYGRAGYLYLLRIVKHYYPAAGPAIAPAQALVIEAILRHCSDPRTPSWRFAGKLYLAVGHGWMGVLAQILLSDPTPSRARQLRPWIATCISEQQSDGNWKSFYDDEESADSPAQARELVSMGHGAPSMLLGLLSVQSIYRSLGQDDFASEIQAAVERGQGVIIEKGLLTQESCLLHGAAGNSLVVLDLGQKAKFMHHSVQETLDRGVSDGSIEASEPRSGLNKGVVGRVWAMMMYLENRSGVYLSFNEV